MQCCRYLLQVAVLVQVLVQACWGFEGLAASTAAKKQAVTVLVLHVVEPSTVQRGTYSYASYLFVLVPVQVCRNCGPTKLFICTCTSDAGCTIKYSTS